MPSRKSERKLEEQRRSEGPGTRPTAPEAGSRPQRSSLTPFFQRNPELLPSPAARRNTAGAAASEAQRQLPTPTATASETAPRANMAEQMLEVREAKIDAEIARLRQQLLVIEEEIKATDTKLDEKLDDRTYNRWNDKLARLQQRENAINAQLVELEGQKKALFNAGAKRSREEEDVRQVVRDLQQDVQQLKRQRPSHIPTTFQEEVASAVRNARNPPPFPFGQRQCIVVNLTNADYYVDLADGGSLAVPPLSVEARQHAAEAIKALPQEKRLFCIGAERFGAETKVVQPLATLVFSYLLKELIPECANYLCVDTHKFAKCYLWEHEAPDGVVFFPEFNITGLPTRQHLNSSNVAVVFEWKGSETLDDKASLPQLIKYLFSLLKASPQRKFVYGFLSDLQHGILVKAWRRETESGGEVLEFEVYTRVSGPDLVGLIQALLTARPEDLDAKPLTMIKPRSTETMRICLGATLGHGASGDVCVGISVPKGDKFAIKGLKTSRTGVAHIRAELEVLRALSGSELLHGKWVNLEAEEWQLNGQPVLKLPLFSPSRPSLWRRAHVTGVVAALQAIHAAGYIHRDVRPSNFVFALVDGGFIPLIIDLGCAVPTDSEPRHYSGSKAYASFRFLNHDDGSLNETDPFEFHANDDLFSLVLSMFSIFMTADGCIEGQPLFHDAPGATRPSYRDFWQTRLPPAWLDLIEGLMQQVNAGEPGAYDRVQGFLEGNLPQLPLFAADAPICHDLNDGDA